MENKIFEILLIEDNPADANITKLLLEEGATKKNINVIHLGEEALLYLKKTGKYSAAPRPHLILLDLNLPTKNGREVLAEIKLDQDLRSIPVLILSISDMELDITYAYDLHANCYIRKPIDLDQYEKTIRALEAFWLNTVQLPVNR